MKKICGIASLLAFALVAATTSAATSSPAAGDWAGQFARVSPHTIVTFNVAVNGKGRRVVSLFSSGGAFKDVCAAAHGASTNVSRVPNATVDASGRFHAKSLEFNSFGTDTWTVSGAFKSKHAAAGTVAIVVHTGTAVCKFTVSWKAGFEALSRPAGGTSYKGAAGNDQAGGGSPITFHVSANGKTLTTIKFRPPVPFGLCPGMSNSNPFETGHDVPIHGDKFTFKHVAGKITHGTGSTTTDTITGQFLSGHKAAGTISTFGDVSGLGIDCQGSNTWTAHAG